MGFFGRASQMLRWNKDTNQLNLALLLAHSHTPQDMDKIESIITSEGWSRDEAVERVAHAISLARVKLSRHSFDNAKALGEIFILKLKSGSN